MPKPSVPVDRAALERAVQLANQYARNESHLWHEAASIYNGSTQPSITHSIVMLRVRSWGIPYSVEKGRKGRADTTEPHRPAQRERPSEPQRRAEPREPSGVLSLHGVVYTPAGEPPVKLKGFGEDQVIEWSHAVRQSSKKALSMNALLYWVNHYFCNQLDHPEEFERIAGILRRMDEGE